MNDLWFWEDYKIVSPLSIRTFAKLVDVTIKVIL